MALMAGMGLGLYDAAAPVRELRRRLRGSATSAWPRIDRVAPMRGRRTVAVTFDDGPTALRVAGRPLTEGLLRALDRYGMRATFNVIGSTADNYPDRPGPLGTPLWNGTRYDHYPACGLDHWGGIAEQPLLGRLVLEAGHELGNHSFRHLAFGPERIVYGPRAFHPGADAVRADCLRLQSFCRDRLGTAPAVARPPHFVGRTADGHDVRDLLRALDLPLVGAAFDLGAWRARRGTVRDYLDRAVRPLADLLNKDGDALDGCILFAKDGLNMSLEAAVAETLPEQLRLLHAHGYRVVPVSELLAAGRFADVPAGDPLGPRALDLLRAGLPCAFGDNTIRAESPVGEAEWRAVARAASAMGLAPLRRPAPGTSRRSWLTALHALHAAPRPGHGAGQAGGAGGLRAPADRSA